MSDADDATGPKQTPPPGGARGLFRRLLNPSGSLSRRMVHGGIWVLSIRAADRLVRLFRTLLLARILGPEDFGIFGVALLAMGVLETFSQTGFQQALIQRKDAIAPYLNTAWTTQAARGCILAALLAVAAPAVAAFYDEPAATSILKVIGLCYVFQGFTNIGVLYFQKELEFHRQFFYIFSGTLIDLAVSIVAAILLRNAWALVLAMIAGDFVRMVVSYAVHPYRPRLELRWAYMRELSHFGRWIMGSNVLAFILNNGPSALVGKVIGVPAMGAYGLAYRLSNLPATEITHVISTVSFPAYAKLQDEPAKLKTAYITVLQVTAFISVPIAGLIFVMTPDFVRLFLKEKWAIMIPAMQLLAVWGLIRSLGATTGPVYHAVGRPWISAQLIFFQVALIAALIYPFSKHWGLWGTAAAVTAAALVPNIVGAFVVLRIVGCGAGELTRAVAYPLAATLPGVGIVLARQYAVAKPVGLIEFFCWGLVTTALYAALCLALDRWCRYGIVATLRKSFSLI